MLGVPIYPGAQFLKSYDAGRGQRFYLYGTTASFVDLVTYYRERLKQRGELVFETPATHEFLVGRFRDRAPDPALAQVGAIRPGGVRLIAPHPQRAGPRPAATASGHPDCVQNRLELRTVTPLSRGDQER